MNTVFTSGGVILKVSARVSSIRDTIHDRKVSALFSNDGDYRQHIYTKLRDVRNITFDKGSLIMHIPASYGSYYRESLLIRHNKERLHFEISS